MHHNKIRQSVWPTCIWSLLALLPFAVYWNRPEICVVPTEVVLTKLTSWGNKGWHLFWYRFRILGVLIGLVTVVNIVSMRHRIIIHYVSIIIQRDTTIYSLFTSGNCSACFGWHLHPSSGAHITMYSIWHYWDRYCYLSWTWLGGNCQFPPSHVHDR